ncbi:unnamed protein product [Rhodiola kirilowii]
MQRLHVVSHQVPPISPNPFLHFHFQSNPLSGFSHPPSLQITPIKKRISFIKCGIRELLQRIDSVKSTHKITEAMKLVAAARVRRAQEAVINSRPFAEALVQVLFELNEQLQLEDVQVPLTEVRPVARVSLVVVTGDRGLCGGFNNVILNRAYIKFVDSKTLVSASTDNTLKLWDLSMCSSRVLDSPLQSFSGHTNLKNFVGLSVHDGYIATGSETNEVFVYHKVFPMPALSFKFNTTEPLSGQDADDATQFISSVCWRGQSSTLVAANSTGNIKILEMA